MAICTITGQVVKQSEVYGGTTYSREALTHYRRMKEEMKKRGLFLGLVNYREVMGYPPLQRMNTVKPLPIAQLDRVEAFLRNGQTPKKITYKGKSRTVVRT